MKKIFAIALVTVALSSCGIYGKYKPVTQVDSIYYGAQVQLSDTSQNLGLMHWDQLFTDPQLQGMIRKALQNNYDLRKAQYSVQQARASLLAAKLAYVPSFYYSGSGTLSHLGATTFSSSCGTGPYAFETNGSNSKTYELPVFSASWNFDVFGSTLNGLRGSKADLETARDGYQAARMSIVAAVAQSYYSLLMLDDQLKTAEQTAATWQSVVENTRLLMHAGMANDAAVSQMEATAYAIQTSVVEIKQSINSVQNGLCILMGEPIHQLQRSTLEAQQLPTQLMVGVPAQMLTLRPDVRAAQHQFESAFYGTNGARSACLPVLNLTGAAGWTNSLNGTSVDPWTFFSSLGASLSGPLFNCGRNIAGLRMAKAAQEQAKLAFFQSLITAGAEVNEALEAYQTSVAKNQLYAQQVQSLQRAMSSTRALMNQGTTTYLDVLTAQNSLLSAQLTQIANRAQQMQAVVSLYNALGGGQQTREEALQDEKALQQQLARIRKKK